MSRAPLLESRRSDVMELKELIREATVSDDVEHKCQVIELMTMGIDVSLLFSEIVLLVDTRDMVQKRLVYMYLLQYAQKDAELASICLNALLIDCRNANPHIRGMAIRSLCSIRAAVAADYLCDPLEQALQDENPYVRRAAALGVSKVYHFHRNLLIQDTPLVDTLYTLLKDSDAMVVVNCLVSLKTIMENEGGIAINGKLYHYLLGRFGEFPISGQCMVLALLTSEAYYVHSADEKYGVMNALDSYISIDSAVPVILAILKVFLFLNVSSESLIYGRILPILFEHLIPMDQDDDEACDDDDYISTQYFILGAIKHLCWKNPLAFSQYLHQLMPKKGEPIYIENLKIQILSQISTDSIAPFLLDEFFQRCQKDVFCRQRLIIKGIGTIGLHSRKSSVAAAAMLIDYLQIASPSTKLGVECVLQLENIVLRHPMDLSVHLSKFWIDSPKFPNGQRSSMWLLSNACTVQPELAPWIENVSKDFDNWDEQVQLQFLTTVMIVFTKSPLVMVGFIKLWLPKTLRSKSKYTVHVNQRVGLYYRMLRSQNFTLLQESFINSAPKKILRIEQYPLCEMDTMGSLCEKSYQVRSSQTKFSITNSSIAYIRSEVHGSPDILLWPYPQIEAKMFQIYWKTLGNPLEWTIGFSKLVPEFQGASVESLELLWQQWGLTSLASGTANEESDYVCYMYAQDVQQGMYFLKYRVENSLSELLMHVQLKGNGRARVKDFLLSFQHRMTTLQIPASA